MGQVPQSYTGPSLETSRCCLLVDGRLLTSWSTHNTSCLPQLSLSILAVQMAPHLVPNPTDILTHLARMEKSQDGAAPSLNHSSCCCLWQVPMGKMGWGQDRKSQSKTFTSP